VIIVSSSEKIMGTKAHEKENDRITDSYVLQSMKEANKLMATETYG